MDDRLAPLPAHPLADGALTVLEATTLPVRLRGLSRMDPGGLPRDAGLHFAHCRSIHTFGMRFALDLIWLDRDGAVVRVDRDVAPRRHRAAYRRARSVLEVNAGCADAFVAAAPIHPGASSS
jgi:uncharacterized protein